MIRTTAVWLCTLLVTLSGCKSSDEILLYEGKKLEVTHGIQSIAWHPDGKMMAVGYFLKDQVEVWDIEKNQAVFTIPSKRTPTNWSGQEMVFSPDGKHLVVQDVDDTKKGVPPISRSHDDPNEAEAQKDTHRFRLATVWDVEQRKKISELYGPGSALHGYGPLGLCWRYGTADQIVMLRSSVVQHFDVFSGRITGEFNFAHPAGEQVGKFGYLKMACASGSSMVALLGRKKSLQGKGIEDYDNWSTPIVLTNEARVVAISSSATLLHNVAFVGKDEKLISYGNYPLRIWTVEPAFEQIRELSDAGAGEAGFVVLPDETHAVGIGQKMEVWNLQSGKQVQSLPPPSEPFRAALSPNGQLLAVASGRTVYFYRNTLAMHEGHKQLEVK